MFQTALNHMTVPHVRTDRLFDIAARLGCVGVELRNDLPSRLFEGDDPQTVRSKAEAAGTRILALAEVKAFNDWSSAKQDEAAALARIAAGCGAEAISLIPRNDGSGSGNGERQANLRVALGELKPVLETFGLIGLVEPLGFEQCSLRHKAELVETIEALGAKDRFRIVHDTFHHFLAGDGPLFPDHTGIVHISGVADPDVAPSQMRDGHRVLVDARDRLGNVRQIEALIDGGYNGPVSFECFAPSVHQLADPETALRTSFDFIRSRMAQVSA